MRPLAGVRVVDATAGLAGQFCAAMLAGAGAGVTRVELPGEQSLAGQADRYGWQAFLDLDKQVVASPASIADADVLLTSAPPARLAELGLRPEQHPGLIHASITPFGDDGPYAGLAGDDVVLCALAGLADATPGFPDRRERFGDPPLQSRAPLAEVGGGIVGAVAVMGALLGRARGTAPVRGIEVSSLEAVASQMVFEWGICAFGGGVRGRRPVPADLEPNVVLPCRDGQVVLVAFAAPHWKGLLDLMGSPEWAQAPEFADGASRARHARELHRHLRAWTETRSGEEIMQGAQERGVPCAFGLELAQTLASEQVRGRAALRDEDGRLYPADPVVVNGERRAPATPAAAGARSPAAGVAPVEPGRGPLSGVRVLDLTQVVAGPYCGMLLAAQGADVVIVESESRLLSRGFAPFVGEPHFDGSMMFNNVNRGKRSVALDLRSPSSRPVLEDLIASSDVVIENLSLRAAAALRLTYEDVRAIRDDVVLASISAFGRTGPWGGYVALHSGVILLSGLAGVTRDEDGQPRLSGAIYPDLLAGAYMACAVQQALLRREQEGGGAHVELAMLDVLLAAMGGIVPGAGDEPPSPHPARFLETVEPGRFLAVSGEAGLDPSEVARETRRTAMTRLQGEGVRAGAVLDVGELLVDPHLIARGFLVADDHPVSGPRVMAGVPWRYDGIRPHLHHAPPLGAHTDEVLTGLDGWTDADTARLHAEGVLA